MILGKSRYAYNLTVEDQAIEIEPTLNILGVTLDKNLSLKPHVDFMLKKAYAKITALRRVKHLVPSDVVITLFKAYVIPHLEYCSPLLLGILQTLKNKHEHANHYALSIASMGSLEERCLEQSLIIFFQSFRCGSNYISIFFYA